MSYPTTTAWESTPKPVRFAVWLWAVGVILTFVASLVLFAIWAALALAAFIAV